MNPKETPARAREFWLINTNAMFMDEWAVDGKPLEDDPYKLGSIHVIEYAEVERLKTELEGLKHLDKIPHLHAAHSELEKAWTERDQLKALLEKIRTHTMPGEMDSVDAMVKILADKNRLVKQVDSLLTQAEQLSQALEEIRGPAMDPRGVAYGAIEIAKMALTKYAAFKARGE